MAGDDAELIALIDNELDEEAKGRLLARMADEEGLRKRYEALRETGAPIAASLDALLDNAPLPRLRAALPSMGAARAGRRPFSGVARSRSRGGICCRPAGGGRGSVGRAWRCALRRSG